MNPEEKRLHLLQQFNILDTPAEEAFDNLAKLASQICGTSAAQINFIDDSRQWTKANIGWGAPEMPKEMSFCSHTIQSDDSMLIIPDTLRDDRFKQHPLTKKTPPLRFYAGVTLENTTGYPLGTLCVFDSDPKQLSNQQLEALQILAEEVETHLKLRLNQNQLEKSLLQENQLNKKIISSLPLNFFMYNRQGKIVRWNEYMKSITGYSDEEIQQMNPAHYFDKGEQEKVRKKMEEVFEGEQVTFEAEFRKKDGTTSPFIFSASQFEMNGETYLIGTGQDITEQKETQYQLERSLKEKETLLAEIHHRVKNNLAVISGLMQLESMNADNELVEQKLLNTTLRIGSIALVHEIMYQSENLTHVIFDDIIQSIAENVKNTYENKNDVTIRCKAEKITLNVNQAIPCGLIINELITNAWKHAFSQNEEGTINVEMNEHKGTITLRITDNGKGLPQNIELQNPDTIGFTVVNQLCNQLNAELHLNRDSGTKFVIEFEKRELKGAGSALNI